jgi:hypothetical protein
MTGGRSNGAQYESGNGFSGRVLVRPDHELLKPVSGRCGERRRCYFGEAGKSVDTTLTRESIISETKMGTNATNEPCESAPSHMRLRPYKSRACKAAKCG